EPIGFPDNIRARHAVFFGATGSGKSRVAESLAVFDVLRRVTGHARRGITIIDVHGDLARNLRARLAILSRFFPQINAELLYISDPTRKDWTVRFNPLELRPGEVAQRKADNLANLVTTIFHEEPTTVVRMYRVSYHTFLALSVANRTLIDVPRFLTDRPFRE